MSQLQAVENNKSISRQKAFGQYMTPPEIVTLILDDIGYIDSGILSKKIMEPSFGDGAFLVEIVRRIVAAGEASGFTSEKTVEVIKDSVFGIEKDPDMYSAAVVRLDNYLTSIGYPTIDWSNNLFLGDTLLLYQQFAGEMDFVVGNPPYVRIHLLSEESRSLIRGLELSAGMYDLFLAFYELGIKMLNDHGRLGYISPNSLLKNVSARKIRRYLLDNMFLFAVYDFRSSVVFPSAQTYTCICLLDKDKLRKDSSVCYRVYSDTETYTRYFTLDEFRNKYANEPWVLDNDDNTRFLAENRALPTKIGDIAKVQNGVVTNRDSVYIFRVYVNVALNKKYLGKHTDPSRVVYFRDCFGLIREIESSILHRCVKSSRFDGEMDNTYIIFPYHYVASEDSPFLLSCVPMSEQELSCNYPKAYKYFLSMKTELAMRVMDEGLDWFLFGRTQGLVSSGYKKVVFKKFVNKTSPVIKPYVLDEDVIVYSGLFSTISRDSFKPDLALCECLNAEKTALSQLMSIYSSQDFARYCALVGKTKANDYSEVYSSMIKRFGI